MAFVSLPKNNAIVKVDTQTGIVVDSFSTGTVDMIQVDLTDDDHILPVEESLGVSRAPIGLETMASFDGLYMVTADEGSRSISIFNNMSEVVYTSTAVNTSLDLIAIQVGQTCGLLLQWDHLIRHFNK